MSVILFVLGIVATGTGIVAIGFGIPINEFNLGNTLIVSGTIASSAGLVLIGLAAAVDQLTQIVQALRPRAGTRPSSQPPAAEPPVPGPRLSPIPGQAAGSAPGQVPLAPKAPMPGSPRGPVFARQKAEDRTPEPAPESEVSPSAIERLRSSLGRPERKAGEPADAEDVAYAPAVPPAGPSIGPNGVGGAGAGEAHKKPPLDFLFRSKAREPQPEPFDAVWPKRGPRRSDEQATADEPVSPASAEVPGGRTYLSKTPPASADDEPRPAAILKSGVVDGMAYTLYADGSIEAQLPQGTVRFGSIAELRSHIENNS